MRSPTPSSLARARPLIIASGTAVLFGVTEPGSAPHGIATVPEFLWERCCSGSIYLIVNGFRSSPATADAAAPVRAEPVLVSA